MSLYAYRGADTSYWLLAGVTINLVYVFEVTVALPCTGPERRLCKDGREVDREADRECRRDREPVRGRAANNAAGEPLLPPPLSPTLMPTVPMGTPALPPSPTLPALRRCVCRRRRTRAADTTSRTRAPASRPTPIMTPPSPPASALSTLLLPDPRPAGPPLGIVSTYEGKTTVAWLDVVPPDKVLTGGLDVG